MTPVSLRQIGVIHTGRMAFDDTPVQAALNLEAQVAGPDGRHGLSLVRLLSVEPTRIRGITPGELGSDARRC